MDDDEEEDDGDTQSLQNLHHDTNERPRRVATVLMYLSGEEEDVEDGGLKGGETLLPCVQPRGRDGDIDAELCGRLRNAFESGERFLSPPGGIHSGQCFDEIAAAAASGLCQAAVPSSGLRITPKRGAAVLFLSASPEAGGGTLWQTWHGGCRVRSGEKWTMQQFKELSP